MRHQLPRTSIGGDGAPSTPLVPSRTSGTHPARRRADLHGLHLHLHDVSAAAAAALSPLLKSKFKTNAGNTRVSGGRVSFGQGTSTIAAHAALMAHDEKKKEDAEREEKLAQLLLPDPGLEAADTTPTLQRLQAQYTSGGPRKIPNSLRTGVEAVAAASAVDVFYTAPFLQLAYREATEREVAARLRANVKKMTSKLHAVRVEGLKEAMSQLLQWTTQASVESAERRREQQMQQQQHRGADHAPLSHLGGYAGVSLPGALVLPPYDAVRVEVLGSSAASPGVARGPKSEMAAAARAANALRSPSWEVVQQALEGVDYTSALFNTILVPRLEVRNAMSTGMPISIQLPSEAALQWTTLPTTARTAPPPPMASPPAKDDHTHPAAPPKRTNELLQAATAVTYEEQELALRYIQGACLTLSYQRRCCSEGCLIYYATEVFQCMRSHAEALFTLQRKALEQQDSTNKRNPNGEASNEDDDDAVARRSPAASPAVLDTPTSRAAARPTVAIDVALVRVVVALVEAVEAACHYNPSCLRRLVQTGGVTAMLNLAYCPFMPTPVRSAVLNAISVLLQEVNPLRRYVAAASKPGEDGAAPHNADPLLQRMLENAMHDNPIGHNGKQIPYSTDRGSASKFDSAVRDWFFANGLGNVLPSVMQLQDLRTVFQSASFTVPQGLSAAGSAGGGPGSVAAAAAGGGGVGGSGGAAGVGAGSSANLPFASVMVPTGTSLHGPLTGRSYGTAGGGGGGGVGGPGGGGSAAGGGAAAAAAVATHANMQREGELYRKRIGRLLECMDGRELR